MIQIRRALPADADTLTRIAIAAKRHWGYPERWMEIWTPQLTFSPQYFDENESWVAEADGVSAAFNLCQSQKDKVCIQPFHGFGTVLPWFLAVAVRGVSAVYNP